MAIGSEANALSDGDTTAELPENEVYDSGSGGSDRCLFVAVCNESTDTTAVTYNSISMTEIGSGVSDSNGNEWTLWRLVAPATGSNTIAITSAVSPTDINVHAWCLNGVDQTTPTGAVATDSATYSTTGDKTTSITTTQANSRILAFGGYDGGDLITEIGPITNFTDADGGDNEHTTAPGSSSQGMTTGIYYRDVTTATGYDTGFNYGSADTKEGAHISVEIIESGAGGGSIIPQIMHHRRMMDN